MAVTTQQQSQGIVLPNGQFSFHGTGMQYLWLLIWTGLLTALTFGIYWAWGYCAKQRWIAANTLVDGKPLRFSGTGGQLFVHFIVIVLLCVITVGLYAPWAWVRIKRWQINNLSFA